MRSATSLTGKRIISVDNGPDLGTVKDVYFDAGIDSVVALFLGNQGLWARKANLIPPNGTSRTADLALTPPTPLSH